MKKIKSLFMILICAFALSALSGYSMADAKSKDGISSVNVINGQVIRVKFSKARKLSAKDVKITAKEKKKDKYKNCAIKKVEKVNSKEYYVILKQYNDRNKFVRLKVGNVSADAKAYGDVGRPRTIYIDGVTNKYKERTIWFSEYTIGKCKCSVGKLPKGMKVKKRDNYVSIYGKPKNVLNGKKTIISLTDEYGKKVKLEVLFYIGSKSKVVTYCEDQTVLAGDKKNEQLVVVSVGGSGKYKCKVKNNIPGVKARGKEYELEINDIIVSDKIPIGKHTVKYMVTDSKGNKATSSFKINAMKPLKLKVALKTADNKDIGKQYVSVNCWDTRGKYVTYQNSVKKSGNSYVAYVLSDMLYEIEANMYVGGDEYTYTEYCYTDKKRKRCNIKTSFYKISLKTSNKSSLENNAWYFPYSLSYKDSVGKGSVIFLKKGSYSLVSLRNSSVYSTSFKVKKSMIAKVDVSALQETGDLDEEKDLVIQTSLKGNVYTFTPSKTGIYQFRVNDAGEESSINASLYSDSLMDDCILNMDARFGARYNTISLKAGHIYYLCMKALNDYTGVVSVKFHKLEYIKENKNKSVSVSRHSCKYIFVPSVTGYYTIDISCGDNHIWVDMSDENNKSVAYNSYGFRDKGSLKTKKKLEAGKIYYLTFWTESYNAKTTIKIRRNSSKKK